MKLIFLDIDGVANNTASCLAATGVHWSCLVQEAKDHWSNELLGMIGGEYTYGQVETFRTIDPTAVSLINRLAEKAGADVVLSSSHRSFFVGSNYKSSFDYGSQEHLHALSLYLKLLGFKFDLYGITPRLYAPRGKEVEAFLETVSESPERYVILDDGKDFMGYQPHVWTDAKLGFTGADYFKAAQELGTNESSIIV